MDQQDQMKAMIKADIEKTEEQLKAKKLLLKQVSKKPSTPFIETKFGRGINHVLAAISTPCAAVHRNARMRLDHPTAYRAEVACDRAEKLLEKLEKINQEVSDKTHRMAALAALHETVLSQFATVDGYEDRIQSLRERLTVQAERLRKPSTGPSADVTSMLGDLMDQLKKGRGPTPQEG